ncbi:MAG TPA: polyprenyl synthetase family protein, partial [Chitinophagales bacterium]
MKKYTDFAKQFENYYTNQKFDERYDVYQALSYIMSLPSKRIRPVLTMMSCDLFGGDVKSALPAAMAVELYHNATLVHDDIMDKADMRRGKPSVHKVYGSNVAINTGDMMFMVAYRYL